MKPIALSPFERMIDDKIRSISDSVICNFDGYHDEKLEAERFHLSNSIHSICRCGLFRPTELFHVNFPSRFSEALTEFYHDKMFSYHGMLPLKLNKYYAENKEKYDALIESEFRDRMFYIPRDHIIDLYCILNDTPIQEDSLKTIPRILEQAVANFNFAVTRILDE